MSNQITVRQSSGSGLGTASLVLAIIAAISCWVPLLGIICLPFAGISIILGLIGLLINLGRKAGMGTPLSGIIVSVVAVFIFYQVTDSTMKAISPHYAEMERMREMGTDAYKAELKAKEDAKKKEEQDVIDYMNNKIQLYDVEAKYFDSVLDGRIPGIRFKIRNSGDKTVGRIEVIAYIKDDAGNTIAEDTFLPIYKSTFSSTPYKPLKPGYVWEEKKESFYRLDAPSEWKEGSVDIKIKSIDFIESD